MKNNSLATILIGIALFIVLMIGSGPFYVLQEGYQAVITQFGKPVGKAITEAGLHLKIPFIQKVNLFEKRILEWDGDANQIPTKDKKYIWVDTTARWRIADPLKFLQSVYNERGGQARLDGILDAAVRDVVTSHNLIDIVRTSNNIISELKDNEQQGEYIEQSAFDEVKVGREEMRDIIISGAGDLVPQYGIELIDVRIKRVNYVDEVREKVYERMIAERKRAAERYRSEGRGKRAEIEGRTEKELKEISSAAYKEAQAIKGTADGESARIYAEAYNKDPELYSLTKTLETYEDTVDANTTVILTTDSEYFTYFKNTSTQKNSGKNAE